MPVPVPGCASQANWIVEQQPHTYSLKAAALLLKLAALLLKQPVSACCNQPIHRLYNYTEPGLLLQVLLQCRVAAKDLSQVMLDQTMPAQITTRRNKQTSSCPSPALAPCLGDTISDLFRITTRVLRLCDQTNRANTSYTCSVRCGVPSPLPSCAHGQADLIDIELQEHTCMHDAQSRCGSSRTAPPR